MHQRQLCVKRGVASEEGEGVEFLGDRFLPLPFATPHQRTLLRTRSMWFLIHSNDLDPLWGCFPI